MDLNKRKIISSCIFFFFTNLFISCKEEDRKGRGKKKVIVPIGKRDLSHF